MQENKPSIKSMEKKVRKEIRLKRLIVKGDTIYILISDNLETQSLFHLLTEIIKDPKISIELVDKVPKLSKNKKLALPNTIEVESELYLKEFIENSERNENFIIKPFIRVTYDECKKYCNKNKIDYKESNDSKSSNEITEFINRLDKKYSVRSSIIKTEESLKK